MQMFCTEVRMPLEIFSSHTEAPGTSPGSTLSSSYMVMQTLRNKGIKIEVDGFLLPTRKT